jgi:hypothetical protein
MKCSTDRPAIRSRNARHARFGCLQARARGIICAIHRLVPCPAHSMLRLRLQKIGSWLGLLAILMSTLAPTVSQALAAHDRLGEALATYCSAEPDNASATQDSKHSHSPAFHWQACAYCGMLAHAPVLPGTVSTFAAAISVARAPIVATSNTLHVPLFYTAAQPRAPPLV